MNKTLDLRPWLLGFIAVAFVAGCARAPLSSTDAAFRPSSPPPIADDLPLGPLFSAIENQIKFLEKNSQRDFRFGNRVIPKDEYLNGLRRFLDLGRNLTTEIFFQKISEEFEFLEVYGNDDGWGQIFITSYFEPLIEGSWSKTKRFTQPLYREPRDILNLNLANYGPQFSNVRQLRGRLVGKDIYPYYSREEIDQRGALNGKKLVLAWVDPIDSFFLQIQGSGTVKIGKKEIFVNYAQKNGHPYFPIGRAVKERIEPEEVTLHTIERYLRSLPPQEMQKILNQNASYVFFKVSNQRAVTKLGVPATPGRTIATDHRYFPKGALAFMSFDKPVFDGPEDTTPSKTIGVSRFVLDQDIGGAIKGGGRVDLFWGRGHEAKRYAGVMKNKGTLYYLVPKPLKTSAQ